jgi:C_GCAxxG_C_C family probable redox protein
MNNDKIDQAKNKALARFADPGPDHINCSQTVLCFALELMGHDCDLLTLASYFGGGIAGMGEACGAVTGAMMAAGARDYYAGSQDPDRARVNKEALQEAMRAFTGEYGSCRCRDLTGYDLSTDEGFKAFKESEAKDRCPLFVGFMIDRVAPLLMPPARP